MEFSEQQFDVDRFSSLESNLAARENELRQRNQRLEQERADVLRRAEALVQQQTLAFSAPSSPVNESSQVLRPVEIDVCRPEEVGDETVPNIDESSNRGIGAEVLIRQRQARLKVLEADVKALAEENAVKDRALRESEVKIKELTEQLKRVERSLHNTEIERDKRSKTADGLNVKLESYEREVGNFRKEMHVKEKRIKSLEQDKTKQDLQLNRALVDVEKFRSMLKEKDGASHHSSEGIRRENARLSSENKKLQQQKGELLNAFRKQLKLIDILKKQKLHMETAKVLQFSEEEFTRALELEI